MTEMHDISRARLATARVFEAAGIVVLPIFTIIAAVVSMNQSAGLMFAASVGSLILFFLSFEWTRPPLRETMPIVVLAALAAAGRIIFAFIPSVQPATAIVIVAGCVFGRRSGFMVGSLSGLVSSFFVGMGAWTPWQMFAWGLIGWLAGVLARSGAFSRPWAIYVYGFTAGLIYGLILNMWSFLGFYHPETFEQLVLIWLPAIPYDITHSVSTVAFLALIWLPWHRKLVRLKTAYGLGT